MDGNFTCRMFKLGIMKGGRKAPNLAYLSLTIN